VLVRTHGHATEVQDALGRAGVPAVIAGAGSVFGTAAAREWLGLLQALERPASPPRAHAAALTPFLGWSASRVAEATDEDWEAVHQRLHRWASVLRDSGVAALAETVTLAEGLPARVLGADDGERALTDLRHVGELLHAAAARDGLGVAALTAWLGRRVAAAGHEVESEERTRRLESDARAVQVLTIHRSKGLEFPVVYVPFAWQPSWIPDQHGPVDFHREGSGERVLDVGVGGPGYLANRARWIAEQRGEDLRLLYVALTRAQHQAVVWWAGSFDSKRSPLGRLVFGRGEDGTVAEELAAVPEDVGVMDRFGALADLAPGCVGVERVVVPALRRWSGRVVVLGTLGAGRFDRDLDLRWRRTSYSDLTAGTYEARVGSEPEEAAEEDEDVPVAVPVPSPAPGGSAVPLAAAPAGVHFGTFVHAVLEAADFRRAGPRGGAAGARRRAPCRPGGRGRGHRGARRRAAGGGRDAARGARRRGACATSRGPTASTS
jgi:exodeoxyribonuclease V beta subunit